MKRRKVFNIPGHAHELTFSCYRRLPLLDRDRTRWWFVESLDIARQKHDVAVFAYVIMPEHAHILIRPRSPETRVERFQKSFKQSVARQALNWLKAYHPAFMQQLAGEVTGDRTRYHFWQPGGGYDRNVESPETLLDMIGYIHANPVRRGLVAHPCDWAWSSAQFWEGLDDVVLPMDRELW